MLIKIIGIILSVLLTSTCAVNQLYGHLRPAGKKVSLRVDNGLTAEQSRQLKDPSGYDFMILSWQANEERSIPDKTNLYQVSASLYHKVTALYSLTVLVAENTRTDEDYKSRIKRKIKNSNMQIIWFVWRCVCVFLRTQYTMMIVSWIITVSLLAVNNKVIGFLERIIHRNYSFVLIIPWKSVGSN